ncbi:AimR family lysis-lysogeny pheromone receptor [Amphibacillus sediminis]|uniref:AimR family lysis-lysogeny pheromone receptor n=1 Tax=Amphibacillus sediminis TaxID=360185 RepID=UPI000835F06C|nr:AimR family lysis-lysogeny pheromone receptor [Amphibacillus sediminis]
MFEIDNVVGETLLHQYHHLNAEQFYIWLNEHVAQLDHDRALRDYFLATRDPYSMCVGLEYLFANDHILELKQLIARNKELPFQLNRDWAFFFELSLAKQDSTLPLEKILEQLKLIKTTDRALKCLIQYLAFSVHIIFSENGLIVNKLDQFEEDVKEVNHIVLLPLLEHRLDIAQFFFHWKSNEMLLARKYGYNALAGTYNRANLANLHNHLCLTYIFDDFDSAIYHLEEAYRIGKELKMKRLLTIINHQNRPFIYAHFNKPEGIITSDISEQAHLAIARGELKLAESLLTKVTKVTPFTKYYLGRARRDSRLLRQSYNDFIEKQGDHFFARLPLNALNTL